MIARFGRVQGEGLPPIFIDPNRIPRDIGFFDFIADDENGITDDDNLADVIGDDRVRHRAPRSYEESDE